MWRLNSRFYILSKCKCLLLEQEKQFTNQQKQLFDKAETVDLFLL